MMPSCAIIVCLPSRSDMAALVEMHDERELERALKSGRPDHRHQQSQSRGLYGGFGDDGMARAQNSERGH